MHQYHPHVRTPSVLSFLVVAVAILQPGVARAASFSSPDILVIGDSQLSFGSGKPMQNFFRNFASQCAPYVKDKTLLARVSKMRTTLIGPRSTSLQSWLTTNGPAWKQLCRKDKAGVNASVRGHNASKGRLFYQMGQGRNFQFCKSGVPPLKAMLRKGHYNPKLIFFYVIGNGSWRLAGRDGRAANTDVRKLVQLLPKQTGCVYMATAPTNMKRQNRSRIKAQANLKAAFAANGNRCSFINSLTSSTIGAIEGKNRYFRRGDKWHPNIAATTIFLNANKPAMCRSVARELSRAQIASDTNRP